MQTIGNVLCTVFKKCGFYLFANQDYMSRVRGGNNFFQLRIGDKPVYTLRDKVDIVVALDGPSVGIHRKSLAGGGIIILDKKKSAISENDNVLFDVPMYAMATEAGGSELFVNSVACGLLAGMVQLDSNRIEDILKVAFADKGEDIIKKNIDAARAGYRFGRENFKEEKFKKICGVAKESLLMTGNDAIALGAIKAGCKFYSAYPMSPSTSIMNIMAQYARRFNIVVEQAEDEIAAVNMIVGASFAGARAMAATSGGGFALMVEGLSLAAMTETPIVIVDAQRPAPATGFPTRTEQADLEFLLHAGHGEFARALFAPGTIEEAFYLTIKAFNIAEKYQVPVLIMTDQHLSDSYRNIEPFDLNKVKVGRFIISKEDSRNVSNYKRYQLTESGISPRAIPSWIEGVIYADSDEHTEEGHITEDAALRSRMVEKRLYKKMAGLLNETEKPTAYNVEAANTILIGFGSTYGVLKETAEALSHQNVGFVHLSQVWPFPAVEVIRLIKGAQKILTVENNAQGQLARLLRRETGIKVHGSILKYDGRPFSLDELMERLNQ